MRAFGALGRPINRHWKDECHVVEMLHPKIFDLMVYLGDIDTHALGQAHVSQQSDYDLGLSELQQRRFPEKPRRFGLRFVQADADIAEKIGLVSEIRAQLCPETGSLPPRGRQAEDRTEAQMIVA